MVIIFGFAIFYKFKKIGATWAPKVIKIFNFFLIILFCFFSLHCVFLVVEQFFYSRQSLLAATINAVLFIDTQFDIKLIFCKIFYVVIYKILYNEIKYRF